MITLLKRGTQLASPKLNSAATKSEFVVHEWLNRKGVSFEFQSQLTGGFYQELGDEKVDFNLTDMNTILRILGTGSHKTTLGGSDLLQKERLIGLGYTVIDLWEEDLEANLDYTMREALRGMEI